MLTRIITAALLIPLALFIVYTGGWIATASVIGIGHLILYEYYAMIDRKFSKKASHFIGHFVFALSMIGLYASLNRLPQSIYASILIGWLVVSLIELIRGHLLATHHYRAYQIRIPISIALLLFSLIALRVLPNGVLWLSLGLGLTWLNDSLGLFIGKAMGKRKLAARISPGKTIAGAVGPLVILTSLIACLHPYIPLPSTIIWITPIVLVFAQLGDLHESLIKRYCASKDSSSIIPGHGGVYDRMDSLLFSISVLYLCALTL
ncbi:phosphatidate cytidylyltransferase [Candidatus Marinamargulisbacteria bacterium]|nr:hypothetical protein [bacterium]MDA7563934.1 phosphatidate cytidylyltransferase [Candidatus Marinamargulisbacteria bacterium]|tara:strand:+ start:4349 stop:5137 length:789 start_codon:yes stop_codon:yes gene_type:complete